jgi:hypothetical protein
VPLPRLVRWRRIDCVGLDIGRLGRMENIGLEEATSGFALDGHEVVISPRAYSVYFAVTVDDAWNTQYVTVGVTSGSVNRGTTLEVHEGSWWVHGRRRRSLDGCLDVDVAATPLTNTLPIRRLGLSVGDEALIRVAWVNVPSLRVTRKEQGYKRIGPIDGSPGLEVWDFWPIGGRTYRLTVDEDGLVVDYQDLAERVH